MYVSLKAENILSKHLKIEEVIFGICEDKPNVLLANLIILNGKYYILVLHKTKPLAAIMQIFYTEN